MVSKIVESAWEIARFAIIVLVVVLPIRAYVAQPFIVSGASMAPTFATGDYLIIDELTYHFFHGPQKGDVIVFRYPNDPSKFFIKRVVGLPNEKVTVDGREWDLKSDEYFVMGDNRTESLDSRIFGPLERKYITGRALVRLWPPTAFAYEPGLRVAPQFLQ